MSQHDPTNTNCDRARYPDGDDVLCTCDEDTPAPSVVMPSSVTLPAGVVTGLDATAAAEFCAAARELDRVRKLMQPAQERFQRAVNTLAELAVTR